MTGDLRYTYDDENQLTRVITRNTAFQYQTKSEFIYDGRGRLRKRSEWTWDTYYQQWNGPAITQYLYDGMRVIQEPNGAGTPQVAYTRGVDLSGTFEGAGGIGGLLARSQGYSGGNWSTHHFYHADGNGNITAMMDTSQALAATYRYDAYGKLLSSSGGMAAANVYRFSSKEFHSPSGLYYYGFRFYDPAAQRWLNRDPLGLLPIGRGRTGAIVPQDFRNLFRCFANNPVSNVDPDGLLYVPSVPIVLFVGVTARCGLPYYIAASLKYEDDKMRHCYASCMIARDCGSTISRLGGLTKETADAVIPGRGGWDSGDMKANGDGIDCAGPETVCPLLGNITRWFRKSCEECCMSKGYKP